MILIGCGVLLVISFLAITANAETLYRYTDKDGKVTYSDKPPKNGEKAEAVQVEKGDKIGNTVKLDTKDSKGVQRQFSDIKARVDDAVERLERAKKALENGRDPKSGEERIVVRKGGNAVIRTEEYFARIANLELAIKKAEEAVSAAKDKYNRNAP
jgi:hypothetical protein